VVDDYFPGLDSNLRPALAAAGDRLTVTATMPADQRLLGAVVDREQPTVVFNLATRPLLYSFLNPATAFDVNTDIALSLAELLRHGASNGWCSQHLRGVRLIEQVPMSEAHPLLPETSYAAGKAASDLELSS